ncbi:ERD1 [Candida oxycetoniae]|uniref:ERD1 n=1 Tax=Candida oxycetoniae TaxID=497107 RepID=A0AAI9WYZ7_9ASCO|nr:ERD1 [Candida oxycetoniae]KAI3405842.2 ERD1 [Candida oxycetoniae]
MDEPPGETKALMFSSFLPLPFRILLLVQLGVTLWFMLNLLLYNLSSSINILQLLNLSYTKHNYAQLDNHVLSSGEFATTIPADRKENLRLIKGIWATLRSISIFNFVCWLIFKGLQYYGKDLKMIYYSILLVSFTHLFYKLFYKTAATPGQIRVFTTMKRILCGSINSRSMRANDILISDSLVSFGKVLNDFALFVWCYCIGEASAYDFRLEFVVLCIPIFIRIKQCWYEYSITQKPQHLLNLVKYSTGFGPLVVNSLIKNRLLSSSAEERDSGDLIQHLTNLNHWWYFLSALNSIYSFIWDIKMDWHLQLFNKVINPREKFSVLRPYKAYPNIVYILAISIDFLLRFIWVLKLFIINEELRSDTKISYLHIFSTFLFGYDVYSFGYHIIEILEIFRRWVWCFIKLESDWVQLKYEDRAVFALNELVKDENNKST